MYQNKCQRLDFIMHLAIIRMKQQYFLEEPLNLGIKKKKIFTDYNL